jgi:drug/metabolite transporter (DMT)-like permease
VAWQLAIAAATCTVMMMLLERPRLDLTMPTQLAAFVYHVLFPQGLAYLLWFSLVTRVSAATAAIGTLLVPVFGVAGTVVLLGDWPSGLDTIGLVLILIAVGVDRIRLSKPG